MQVAASIFKAYDIRGIVPSTVDEAVAEGLGKAFGTLALREGQKISGGGPGRPLERPGYQRGTDTWPGGGGR